MLNAFLFACFTEIFRHQVKFVIIFDCRGRFKKFGRIQRQNIGLLIKKIAAELDCLRIADKIFPVLLGIFDIAFDKAAAFGENRKYRRK